LKSMRNEILGIFLFFLVIFTLISLLTYSPADPSIHHVGTSGGVDNFFGLIGAYLSGILIGLFGVGAFWIPVLLLLASIQFFKDRSPRALMLIGGGGLMLVVVTGGLFAIYGDSYEVLGSTYTAGGMIGHPLRTLLLTYSNTTGGTVILLVFFIIGFILTTGVSFLAVLKNGWKFLVSGVHRLKGGAANLKKRRKEAKEKKSSQARPKKTAPKKKSPRKKAEAPQKEAGEGDITIKEAQWIKQNRSPVSKPKQQVFESMRFDNGFRLPSVEFLKDPEVVVDSVDNDHLREMSRLLEQKLDDFGVKGKVATVAPGPVITRFEFEPAPGIKINKVVNLSDDLALALKAMSIRIIAPIPGKAVIGIEVPNAKLEGVVIKDIVSSSAYEKSKSKLPLGMGKDIVGSPVIADLQTMPHLLIAGATGTGKSVALNTMICSLLYKATPEDVKFIMIDPKRIELSAYNDIPHMITPVVTDMKKATNALFWAVKEMERRYQLLSENRVRNIEQYNRKIQKSPSEPASEDAPLPEKLPYIVIIIDELADLMMVSSRDVEVALTRLAQMARAAGIHLILATQRPSVDVLTGVIKANFPTRLSFQVSSKTDSRTIIDTNGAETLLGNGDMLFLPPGTAKLQRIHGAYISEEELTDIVEFLKTQKSPDYNEAVLENQSSEKNGSEEKDYDERYDEAVALVAKTGQASISMVQRHLRVGYNRAARIIELMEEEGVVGPSDGVKPREVLVRNYEGMS